jgi:RimJ/RimL family protein N-acetyltransferase
MGATPVVSLVPMDETTYPVWREGLVAAYANDQVTAGLWTQSESIERSRHQFDELLPDGRATAGHELWTIVDGDGANVGALWLATRTSRDGHGYIYDIEIIESRRGEGLGRAALQALDEWAQANGLRSIGLNVFGHNERARHLYLSHGYIETAIQMEKRY